MPVVRFWLTHREELATLLAEHVLLVAIATLAAVAIGVPLGVFAARRPRLASPLVGIANVVQTIPSLAMFGFLLPVPLIGGVGARAALVVLVLYALLADRTLDDRRPQRHRSIGSRGRPGHGDDGARAAAAGRAAAGTAVDHRRYPGRGRGRRRIRDDRGRHRRRRARTIHLSRPVDGGQHGHPRGRDSRRAARADRRRRAPVAGAAIVAAPASQFTHGACGGGSVGGPLRWASARSWRPAPAGRSWWDRRTSPSS